jgi:hypothetical protein
LYYGGIIVIQNKGVSMECPPVEPSKQSPELSSLPKLSKEEAEDLKQHGVPSNSIFRNVSHVIGAEGPMKKMASLIFQMVFSAAHRAKRNIARRYARENFTTKKTSKTARELFEKEIGEE